MISYILTRSHRKTLAIYIKPGGTVEVRAPLRLAKSEIDRFIESKSQWIQRRLVQMSAKQAAAPRELPPQQYTPDEFERVVSKLVKMWEGCLDVTASFIGLRTMSSRWGSCTAKTRRIRLNTALAYCPRECLEYVIVHELAHILENNHSRRFWEIVEDKLPDYKMRQMKLESLSWLLYA